MVRRWAVALSVFAGASSACAAGLVRYDVSGDAIATPLGGMMGDPARGRAIIVDRQKGLCLLCHTGPFPDQRFQGDIGPGLDGVGARLSEGQLRLRVADSTRINPQSVMPSYHRIDHLTLVAPAHRGKPILGAQEIEDVVAFLATLRGETNPKEMK